MRDAEALTVQGRLRAASGVGKIGRAEHHVKEKQGSSRIYTWNGPAIGPTTDRSAETIRVYTSNGT
jgi:hypothetical protein